MDTTNRYKGGIKTDAVHQCPNKKQNGSSLTAVAITETPKPKPNVDSLAMIKVIATALNEYIAIHGRKVKLTKKVNCEKGVFGDYRKFYRDTAAIVRHRIFKNPKRK